MAKSPARPKYVSNRTFIVGTRTYRPGDPVEGGRALDLALRFGYVDSTAKSATDPNPTAPETADQQETPS